MVSEAWTNRHAQSLTAFAAEHSSSMLAIMSRFVLRAIWLTLCPICHLRPDGLQLFDDGARLAFLFRGFEVGARLMRLDQVTRDADAFHVRGRADLLEFLVGNADEDPPAAGPSRPVLLVPAHGAHAPFHVSGRRGRFAVRRRRHRRRRRNHRHGAVRGAVQKPSALGSMPTAMARLGEFRFVRTNRITCYTSFWQRPGKRTFYICLTSGRSYALHMSSVCCHACRHAWRYAWFTYGSHMFSIR